MGRGYYRPQNGDASIGFLIFCVVVLLLAVAGLR